MDTIFAISSGRPPAAIAVMRISGPAALSAARQLAGTLPTPRHAAVRALRDDTGGVIDRALTLVFPGPRSATGEDLVEFHLHGGRAVVAAAEAALSGIAALRSAEPGEFTRRALENGRIDLVQAQGLADLLEAETEQQRRQAILQTEGATSRQILDWMDHLSMIGALIEAAIDFDDEDDVAPADTIVLTQQMATLRDTLAATLARPSVERYREGLRVVLVGPPNAGKSSLFNAMLGRDAAIVSPIAGTTRDRVEASVVRQGTAYTLVDTAGLRDEPVDPIERIGIARAIAARDTADLILDLADTATTAEHVIAVHARVDARAEAPPTGSIATACNDPASIDRLWDLIDDRQRGIVGSQPDFVFHEQQRSALAAALQSVEGALHARDSLIQAEEIRSASRSLGAILGIDATEAMLDALFGRFCIGK
jgi:tRNA modification GTPase